MITDDSKIAEIFNNFFSNIVWDLGINIPDTLIHHSPKHKDRVVNAISENQSHLSIKLP